MLKENKKYWNATKERIDEILPYRVIILIKKILKRDQESGISKKYIKKLINKNEKTTILEIGSNRGTDTREFLHLFKNLEIYCFEPDLRCIKKFKRRIRDKRCKLFEIAISNKDGFSEFYISGGGDYVDGRDGSSSLKKPKDHLIVHPDVTFEKKRMVKTMKLDSWAKENGIKNVDFIWADVQGAEGELIKGGIETLKNTRYFYTEFDDRELYAGQPNLKEICKLLPMFEVVGIYDTNVLLKNRNL